MAGRAVEAFVVEEDVFVGEVVGTIDEVLTTTDKVEDGLEEILDVTDVARVDAVEVAGEENGRVDDFIDSKDFEETATCDDFEEEVTRKDDEAGVVGSYVFPSNAVANTILPSVPAVSGRTVTRADAS
jgi:hypothetical protein